MKTFLDTATRAAHMAGEIMRQNLGTLSSTEVDAKQASDFVTRVDRESEDAIVSLIKSEYPDHFILAEEGTKDLSSDGYRWIIDPLDGTTNYIHNYPVFAVSIALEYRGECILGVVYDPTRDEFFHSEQGKGAFLNGNPLGVSTLTDLSRCLITTGFPFKQRHYLDKYLEVFKRVFNRTSDIRRAGAAALDFAYLAAGRCDGFFELGLAPWDIAAGSVMIKEAGGIITDFSGGDDYLWTGNVVAGTEVTHPQLLKEVQAVFGSDSGLT
ncbi:inositol monophosphatase family protein [Nitrospirota bacterium]